MRAAEQIKRRYVFDPDEFDQDAYAEVAGANGERLSFPREYIKRPLEKSMDESVSYTHPATKILSKFLTKSRKGYGTPAANIP